MKIFRKIFLNPSFGDISIPFLSQGCFLDAGESTGEARRRGTLLPDADDPVGHLRSRNGVVRHVLHSAAQLGGAVEDVTDYTIPGTEVTHRVVRIRKERPTPAGFPRAFARIKKAPLR